MAEKTYNWNTEPVENLSNDSEWQKFVEGATKERIRKERKAELDKQKNDNAKPKTPMTGTDWVKFAILVVVSVAFILPILLVLMNSFKTNVSVSNEPFAFPNGDNFVGFDNYTNGIEKINFFPAFFTSIFITVFSVAFIILCTSMCAWFITRVKTWYTKLMYLLFAFSMIVPFQMVMYPMSYVANQLSLDNMFGIIIIYLGFGAGLSVFMFAGFIKSVPLEIAVAILNAMWIWNDYLLPTLILNRQKTLPMAIQYLRGGYGSIDMAAMMAMLVLAIIPIIIFYFSCQKYIIKGVVAGAVKG